VLFLLVVALLAYLAWWLGEWQFHRLDQRRADNAVVERNEDAATVPVSRLLSPGRPVSEDDEWRRVRATGEYAPEDTVIVRYRTREGASGVDVVVPLVTRDGTALLVDRGWLLTDNAGQTQVDVPSPPAGEVTVTGWVRADAQGDSATVTDLSTRAISSVRIGPAIDRRVYGGFVDLIREEPAPATELMRAETPDLGEGPHFFYGLQWWFFGLLAIGGFVYLAYDEWRDPGGTRRRRGRGQGDGPAPPAPASDDPTTHEAAGTSPGAAGRPGSSDSS
jgi:cytochrome oxidase assembly protein ShyY1